ncbi:hypothetical protein ABQ366_04495 [Serratia fonticola]|uniref:hypothetical protein n=1 Tax=Serratia fonticola TaxID=47917 RepID=UPI003AAF7E2D
MKQYKKTLYCILATIVVFSLLFLISMPAYKYWSQFHQYGISNKNQDWASFGSFIGGMYGPILSFISVLILCITLWLTKKYNNEQLSMMYNAQTKADFCSLFDKLSEKMDKHKYGNTIINEYQYITRCEQTLIRYLPANYSSSDVFLNVNKVFNATWFCDLKPYYDMTLIALEILKIFDSADSQSQSFFLSYMESKSETDRLFWLICFLQHEFPDVRETIARNPRILRLPKSYLPV